MNFKKKVKIAMIFWLTAVTYILVAQVGGLNPLQWIVRAWIAFVLIDLILVTYWLYVFKNRPQ